MKKAQLKEILRKMINEELALESKASEEAKRQGLEYMSFGRWGKDGKVTHTTQSGKLVPVRGADGKIDRKLAFPPRVHKSPEAQRAKNQPYSSEPSSYLQVRDGATPVERKLVGKVSSMFDKVTNDDPDFLDKHMGKSYPAAEFEKMTGISAKAAKVFTNAVDDYEAPFQYNEDDDTIYIADPMDV